MLRWVDMWPFSYFKKKSEERKQKLKAELLAELLPEFEKSRKKLVDSAKGELSGAYDSFMQDIDKRKKGIQADVDDLRRKVTNFGNKADGAVNSARDMRKKSERMHAVADDISKEAEEAAKTRAAIEERAGNIDAKLKEFAGLAVEQCTEKVGSLERELLQALREDHRLNLNDAAELVEENNIKRMGQWRKDIDAKADEAVQKLQETTAGYAGKLKDITEQSQSALTQLKDDSNYLVDTFRYIRQNIPLVAYALQLSDQQKHFLRELFGEKYDGDLNSLRKDIREKSRDLQGQRTLSPDELGRKFAERDISEMVGYVKRQKRNLRALLETVDRIDNVYQKGSGRGSRIRQ